jgi:hypothetical protein
MTDASLGYRDLLADRLSKWVGEDLAYPVVDGILDSLRAADWTLESSQWVDELCAIDQAALAVAGAELNGCSKEEAWTAFEATLKCCHGDQWANAARMALNVLRTDRSWP